MLRKNRVRIDEYESEPSFDDGATHREQQQLGPVSVGGWTVEALVVHLEGGFQDEQQLRCAERASYAHAQGLEQV